MKGPNIRDFEIESGKTYYHSDIQYNAQKSAKEIFQDPDLVFLQLLINDYVRHSISFVFPDLTIDRVNNGNINFFFEQENVKGDYRFCSYSTDDSIQFENYHRRVFPICEGYGTKHLQLIEEIFKAIRENASRLLRIIFSAIERQKSTQVFLENNHYNFTKDEKGNLLAEKFL